jgi:hypothetical protein
VLILHEAQKYQNNYESSFIFRLAGKKAQQLAVSLFIKVTEF